MRRWIVLAASLYPRSWREEYGEEFSGLLEEVRPSWRVFGNVLRGAITMQLTRSTSCLKLAAAMAAAGAVIAGALSFTVPRNYVSSAVIGMTAQPDPVRPASPQALEDRAADHLASLETDILSRSSLVWVIQKPSLDLYKKDRRHMPMEDIVEKMRSDIHVEGLPAQTAGAPVAMRISFAYPDQQEAQAVLRELVTRLAESNRIVNRNKASLYEVFWQDQIKAHEAQEVPPPPTGESLVVIDPPSAPEKGAGPNRIAFVLAGILAGGLLGVLAGLARLRRRGGWMLAASAAAGLVLASAVSFLLPDRYVSTAVMRLTPPQVTEDPLRAPAAVTAAQRLRELQPEILTDESLARIILQVEMYRHLRQREPMEQAVESMRRDLRIEPMPAKGIPGTASAFRISFLYTDRYKAQQAVRYLITAFTERNIVEQRMKAQYMTVTARRIEEHKAGMNLEVLDPASLPELPVSPNRGAIALGGVAAGLLACSLGFWRRRHPTY
jgi:uncharacterized protein involved in exopolysaccharide biosynthesis